MTARPADLDGLDLRDGDYPALNCRAGIFAAILRTGAGIDPSPVFLRTAMNSRQIVGPIERAEIAGMSFGNVANGVWTELFGLRVVERPVTSHADMVEWLEAALCEHRLVLAAHDGFWDPLATDKYLRHHVRHNSLIYGRAAGGGYRIADRQHRATIAADVLWRCMAEETAAFVVLTDAVPFAGDWAGLLALGARGLREAMTATLTPPDLARIGAALAADLRSPEGRWQQSHLYFLGIGRSRALFAEALAGAGLPQEPPGLAERLRHAAAGWAVVGRWIYKNLSVRRPVDVAELTTRVRSAEAADAAAAQALNFSAPPAPR